MDFQSRNRSDGTRFEEACKSMLEKLGCEIVDRNFAIEEIGIEVDFVVRVPSGMEMWVECKGGDMTGQRVGAERTDNVKKALCNALLANKLEGSPAFVLLVSAKPSPGSKAKRANAMIAAAIKYGALYACINVNDRSDVAVLRRAIEDLNPDIIMARTGLVSDFEW